ncbi:MAG: hypothetical protein E7570_05725 [Ruminococcaceae bacterium]|nr:hypothetical protein [Oscillospiraceae bacterium]
MKHSKALSLLLSFVIAFSVCAFSGARLSLSDEQNICVQEALNSYSLGYMSWGVKSMGLDKLQEKLEKSGKELPEVKVAVVDSGINTSNKYVKGRYTDDGYNFIDKNTDIEDSNYHGTMVSGIIADATSSNVKVLPLKVNNKNGTGYMSNVSKAIYYAIEHNADVINLSLSAEDPNHSVTVLDDAIDAAVKKGIVVVVASGNQSAIANDRYPGNKDNVLTITSVDKNNNIGENANTGSCIDFALPGVSITAPYKRIMFVDTGTSLAAPHAAAAAALLKTCNKKLNQDDIKEILINYSVDLGENGFDNTYGWGMINLADFDINSTEPEILSFDGKTVILTDNNGKTTSVLFADYINKRYYPLDLNDDGIVNAKDYAYLIRNYM